MRGSCAKPLRSTLAVYAGILPVVFFAGVASAGDSIATTPDSSDYRLEEIVVEAPRPITTIGGASGIEVQVDSLVLPAAPMLDEALRDLPMLHVRMNSRGEAEISARGSESRQVAVLVDGVPITLAWDARADVSVIPATGISGLSYIRGLSSMLYGPNVLGGIVETSVGRSLQQPSEKSFRITSGVDDVGSYGGSIVGELPLERLGGQVLLRGGVGYRNTPGQPLAKDVTEVVKTDDNLRLNTDAENLDGFLSLRHRTRGGAWVSLSGSAFREERGIAAELGVPDEDARLWRYPRQNRALGVMSLGTGDRGSPFGGRGDVEASFAYDRGETDIDSYASREYEEVVSFEDGKDRTMTLRLLADQTVTNRGDLKGAFTLSNIRHEEVLGEIEDSETTTTEATYRQRLMSFGGEADWHFIEGGLSGTSLTGSIGAAYDVGETPESGGREPKQGKLSKVGGRAGLTLGLADGKTVLHAGVSRRGRFPALRELYSGALNRFAPNPDLKPEQLLAMEGGATFHMGGGRYQIVGFHHRLEDAIVRITLEDRRFMRVNRNELKSTGVELLASHRWRRVSLSGDATFQNVELTDTDAAETHKPENLPEVFGSLGAEFLLPLGIAGGARLDYTGQQSSIDPATGDDTDLDPGTQAGAYLSRTWFVRQHGGFSSLELRVSVDNATDEAVYDSAGLPEPGRRFRFEVRLF